MLSEFIPLLSNSHSSLFLQLQQCQTWLQTHQTCFLDQFCTQWQKKNPAQYAARLLLYQQQQWLNRGVYWNNPSVSSLVPHTSCLTKLNPCWCQSFRPCLCYCLSRYFNMIFFVSCSFCSVFLSEPWSILWVTGCWPHLQEGGDEGAEQRDRWVDRKQK